MSYYQTSSSPRSKGPAPFLSKTYALLEEEGGAVEDSGGKKIVSWNDEGSGFVVWSPAEFSELTLPRYFKHNNFSSFIRQLNTYEMGIQARQVSERSEANASGDNSKEDGAKRVPCFLEGFLSSDEDHHIMNGIDDEMSVHRQTLMEENQNLRREKVELQTQIAQFKALQIKLLDCVARHTEPTRIARKLALLDLLYKQGQQSTLYSRISPLGSPDKSVVAELEDWPKHGNNIRVGEIQRIIHDLRKRKRFTQALQVSEWMNRKGLCAFSPTEHAVLISKVRGFASAESYFNKLKDQDKTDKTYGAILNCYERQQQTDKSLSHLRKMELGFASTALIYNDIMCLYTNTGQHEKVPDVMREMKENVSPDNFSLTEKAIDALKKSERKLDNKDGTGYNHLISLYASLGDKAEVLRLWGLEKTACKRYINKGFVTMLQSLVKLDELEEAEKVLENGLHEKAEVMLENLLEKGKTTIPNSWGLVAAGYLDKGDKGSVSDTEEFVESLRRTIPVDRKMYHALLKANT
ncbi:Glutaredoxin S17 [Hibiscus syriacus]|uniref:Glutaredoxin S17 n=1 Tax=Hibiscus syriacus TaxID=106335 RepID=A0A6A3BTT6_HIBSY|nr:Glutaredoxin S17 [Hibiscus syriacus]